MSRFAVVTLLALALGPPARAAQDPLAAYRRIEVKPSAISLFIARVTLEIPTFIRRPGGYASSYSAKVFPYFYTERGRIWIDVPDAGLIEASKGHSVAFTGHAETDSGDGRKIEGEATPTGAREGRIRVKVIISKRIFLTFDSTYRLEGTPAVTAR